MGKTLTFVNEDKFSIATNIFTSVHANNKYQQLKEIKMDIRTNYSIQPVQIRTKNNVKSIVSDKPETATPNSVNFTGIPNFLKPEIRQVVKMDKKTLDLVEHAGSILGVEPEKMQKLVEGKTMGHMRLLNVMSERFNANNFGKAEAEREDGQIVINLFKRIEKPEEEHIGFVNRVRLTMTDIDKCFRKCEDDPKKISELENVYGKLGQGRYQDDIMSQIINSPNYEEYTTNIDKYIPHFNACDDVNGVISKFDQQIAAKTEDFASTYKNKDVSMLLSKFPEVREFNEERLLSSYNKDRYSILNTMGVKFQPTKQAMEAGDYQGYLKIYETTTKDNVKFRKNFLNANYYNFGSRDKMSANEINDLALIFEYADKNPNAKKFLEGLTEAKTGLRDAAGYIELFDKVGAERLSQDVKPIKNLIKNDMYEPTKTVMKYYETLQAQPDNILTSIKNLFVQKAEIKQSEVPLRNMLKGDLMTEAVEKTSSVPRLNEIVRHPMVKPVNTETVTISNIKPVKTRRSFFKPFVPQQPSAKKLVIINDVDGMVKNILGSKVYGEQKSIYALNATKMRAGMLPEIFASIKDTRAMERANKTFKKHSSVSNAEAVDLYRRINGKNKKLVNYMLKKTDANGNRMFSVRDVLDTLADANRSILEGQRNSTKFNRFTSKDERAIYDNLLNNKIEEFGKLKRTKKA